MVAGIQERARTYCGPVATAGGRYGEVRAVLRSDFGKAPAIEAELDSSASLNEDDRRCVLGTAGQVVDAHAQNWGRDWAGVKEDVVFYVALGTGPPLFPSGLELQQFVGGWLVAKTSETWRPEFAEDLPEGVVLDDDDRLSIPNRPAFTARLDRWLETIDTPIDPFWEGANPLYAGLEPRAKPLMAEGYLIGNQALFLHYETMPDPSRQAICLLPLDDRLREDLKARLAERTTCLVGDLRDMSLHPRTEFPTGRRFRSIAVGEPRACAIDESGTPVCCGARLKGGPPAETFSMIAVGTDFDCGLVTDGRIRCWGYTPPLDGVSIVGPFSQVAVALREVCAIRSDTGVVQCLSAEGGWRTVAWDRTRDLAAFGDGLCELLKDGRIFCHGGQGWAGVAGRFRAFAASSTSVCGVTAAGNAVQCWRDRPRWGWYTPKPDPIPAVGGATAEPNAVALAGPDGCALGRSGRVTCWRSRAGDRWDGVTARSPPAKAASAPSPSTDACSATATGRIASHRPRRSGNSRKRNEMSGRLPARPEFG